MTTRVTVDVSNHTIEVTIVGAEYKEQHVLEVNTPPTDYWIHGDHSITIREIHKEPGK